MWDDERRQEWFRKPQWQRLDLLNARASVVDDNIPVMPITLSFENDNYSNIKVAEGLPGAVTMYYNKNGYFYLDHTSAMSHCGI